MDRVILIYQLDEPTKDLPVLALIRNIVFRDQRMEES